MEVYDKTCDLFEIVELFSLSEDQAKSLIQTAKGIANSKTYKKSNRLISPKRLGKIAPAVPKSSEDLTQFDPLVSLFKQGMEPEHIRKRCSFLLSRMNTSEYEIRVHNIETAYKLVSFFSDNKFKPKWLFELSPPRGQEEGLLTSWQQRLPKADIVLSANLLSSKSQYSEGEAKLSLQSPRFEKFRKEQEKKGVRQKYHKLSNPVLRYVAHLLLIASTHDLRMYGE